MAPIRRTPRILDPLGNVRSQDVRAGRDFEFPSPTGAPALPPPLVDRGPQLPPRNARSADAGYARLVFPPWIEKIGGISRDFGVQDYQMTLAAGVGQVATSTNLRFQLPTDSVGWLQQFRVYFLSPTPTSLVQWAIRINQGPVPGFDAYQNTPGTANLVVLENNDLRIRLPMGSIVDVLITNLTAGGPFTVGGRLGGWYHPLAAELEAWGPV